MSVQTKQASDRGPDFLNDKRADEIESLTRRIFDTTPTRVAFPGGKSRSVFMAEIDGKTYAFAKRGNKYDAKVESIVLKALSPSGLVPAFIARNGKWVVQQCLFGKRLPILLDENENSTERTLMVAQALDGLVEIQRLAHQARLQTKVPRLGVVDNWIENRIGYVDKISGLLDINAPQLNRKAIKIMFDVRQSDFVKWDARPGNALVEDGHYRWFDWEDCGKRCSMDDLVCLLSDEWTNVESKDEAKLEYRTRDGKWWDRDQCLKGDKVGVTAREVTRLCDRMIDWSQNLEMLKPYADWATDVKRVLGL